MKENVIDNVIEIKNLTKTYGKSRGVTDISMSVERGDFFGFIGPNGAGKSTTIRTMLGLIHKDSGSIKIFGMDNVEKKVDILKRIGYMPSETMFYPQMRVSEIIKMTADAYKMDCKEEAEILCDRLKVETKKRIEELSLGNRKKISIVCALQHNPELYILDEPTSGLDPLMQREFFKLLSEKHKAGATVFLSSHILSEIQTYSNRAAIIKDGKLISVDSVENLARTNTKKVRITGTNETPELKGISDIMKEEDSISFLFRGKAKELIASVHRMDIQDIVIEEPSLEEVFMHFYEKKE